MAARREWLIRLRERAGLSQAAVGKLVDADRQTVYRWENGLQDFYPRHRPRLARALAISVEELDRLETAVRNGDDVPPALPVPSLALPSLAPDPDLHQRISQAVEEPRRLDSAAVDWLDRCLAEHRRAEDELGSAPMLGVVRAQLSTVTTLALNAKAELGDRLIELAAEYAQFMAWLCNDSGDKTAASGWYDRSHGWAIEAGSPNLAATALSMKAHLAWSLGDPVRTVRLGEAARSYDARLAAGVAGQATQMIARGQAIAGEASQARASLDEAEGLVILAAENPDDEPRWLYFYDETWFMLQRGMVELANRDASRAIELLVRALGQLPAHYRRDRAWYSSLLARAHLLGNDLDAATEVAVATATDALAVNQYAADELRGVAADLGDLDPKRAQALAAHLQQ